ncbi:MAG: hypothetical protein HY513_00905 [Candidatus Aenigmarchaeota archaeon]|nr:hypothetical protein [Candidatus Aenigmarchaeota archaeon]
MKEVYEKAFAPVERSFRDGLLGGKNPRPESFASVFSGEYRSDALRRLNFIQDEYRAVQKRKRVERLHREAEQREYDFFRAYCKLVDAFGAMLGSSIADALNKYPGLQHIEAADCMPDRNKSAELLNTLMGTVIHRN